MDVFAERGLDEGSVGEIAKRSGISKATVFHYFPQKTDLVEAVVRAIFEDDLLFFSVPTDETSSIRELLLSYGRRLAETLTQNKAVFTCVVMIYSRAIRDPAIRTHLSTYFARYHAAVRQMLEIAVRRGELPESIDTSSQAETIISLIEGSILLARLREKNLPETVTRSLESYLEALE